jgi:hypothetical protein
MTGVQFYSCTNRNQEKESRSVAIMRLARPEIEPQVAEQESAPSLTTSIHLLQVHRGGDSEPAYKPGDWVEIHDHDFLLRTIDVNLSECLAHQLELNPIAGRFPHSSTTSLVRLYKRGPSELLTLSVFFLQLLWRPSKPVLAIPCAYCLLSRSRN